MANIYLTNGNVNLYDPAYGYGQFNDYVYAVSGPFNFFYQIVTFRGNDLVDLRDSSSSGGSSVSLGEGNDTLFGSRARDVGGDGLGNDLVSLGADDDFWSPGQGNDVLDGGAGLDEIRFVIQSIEFSGVFVSPSAGVRLDLSITGRQDLGFYGQDIIRGFERVSGTFLNDTLLGTSAGDTLFGNDGNDRLIGRGGSDSISGGVGRDVITGGAGADRLSAGDLSADGQRDSFVYLSMADSPFRTNLSGRDVIATFDAGTVNDVIDLRAIDARASTSQDDGFVWRGTGAFRSAGGEVRLVQDGANLRVLIDTDRDAAPEMEILFLNQSQLDRDNFLL